MDSTPFTVPIPAPTITGPVRRERRANPGDEKTIDPNERHRRALEAIVELGQGR